MIDLRAENSSTELPKAQVKHLQLDKNYQWATEPTARAEEVTLRGR